MHVTVLIPLAQQFNTFPILYSSRLPQQKCLQAVGHALELLGSKAQQEEAQHRA